MTKIAKASVVSASNVHATHAVVGQVKGESRETKRYREIVPHIEKRDGRVVPFEFEKIASVIEKAMSAAEEGSVDDAILVAHQVAGELARFAKKYKNFLPTVEGIQDSVEKQLMLNDFTKTDRKS